MHAERNEGVWWWIETIILGLVQWPCYFVVVQSLSHIQLFANPWTVVCQASVSFTISWSLLKLMSIESVMPSNHLILCHPLLLLPSVFPRIRVFSNVSALLIKWPKYWSFSSGLDIWNFQSFWLPLIHFGYMNWKAAWTFTAPLRRISHFTYPESTPNTCSPTLPNASAYKDF